MFARTHGSTQTILIIVAVILVVGVGIYLWVYNSNQADMRTFHCSTCNKDFQTNINKLGNSAPMCPTCGKNDNVTMMPKKS